ncbi:MAG: LacI family DNA-binding transcriptional regulator [Verrucomicrobia bacterium]|nr:LacI family DNA-binding transcriptional regulator [Verrucomicrobiota bacterium]
MTRSPSLPTRAKLTLKDLAARLGVSAMTVSNAFNRPDQLSPELRSRILRTASELGYDAPAASGRMLRTGKAHALGLCCPDPIGHLFADPNAAEFMKGIAEDCQERQVALTILPGFADAGHSSALDSVALDGIILYAAPDAGPFLERVLRKPLPIVTVDGKRRPGFASVSIEDRPGACEIADLVLAHGHRRCALFGMEIDSGMRSRPVTFAQLEKATCTVTRERARGFREAFDRYGVAVECLPCFEVFRNDAEQAYRLAQDLFEKEKKRPTAILCMSDRIALGVIGAARACGFKVPGDISITGFDDIPGAALSDPALTTVRQPARGKGRTAALLLLQNRNEAIQLPVELIVRRSVGPVPASPPAHWPD